MRYLLVGVAILVCGVIAYAKADSAPPRFLKIGTGSVSGTYFVMGGLLANVLSNPPGSRPCDVGGSCGVPNLIVVTQATEGSGANLSKLRDGTIDIALAQGDSVHFAANGLGEYKDNPFKDLRAIGHLYYDAVHVVVRADSDIRSLTDLAGKRVVIGDAQSGTLASARLILDAFGVLARITPVTMKPAEAGDALLNKTVDAFFFVGGQPVPFISTLSEELPLRLLPITGEAVTALQRQYPFFSSSTLPASVYGLKEPLPTISVSAQLVTTARQPYRLVQALTKALWHPTNIGIIRQGHTQGGELAVDKAVAPISITLHAGAERFYREEALIPEPLRVDASPPTSPESR